MKYLKFIFIIVLFSSCTKEEPDYHFIPQLLLDYAYYEKGSYWVYQNDSTYETDSVYVTSIKHYYDSIDADKRIVRINEVIEIEYESSRGVTYLAKLKAGVLYYYINNARCHLMTVIDNSLKDAMENYYMENSYDYFTLSSNTYSDVVEINSLKWKFYDDARPSTSYYDTYWISKGNWIIKQHILTDDVVESWSLIKSKAIQ